MKGLELNSCEEQLKEVGLFSLRKGSSGEILLFSAAPWKVRVGLYQAISRRNRGHSHMGRYSRADLG